MYMALHSNNNNNNSIIKSRKVFFYYYYLFNYIIIFDGSFHIFATKLIVRDCTT